MAESFKATPPDLIPVGMSLGCSSHDLVYAPNGHICLPCPPPHCELSLQLESVIREKHKGFGVCFRAFGYARFGDLEIWRIRGTMSK